MWAKKKNVSGVLGMDDKKLGLAKMVIQFLTQADSWSFDGCFVYVLVWYSHDQTFNLLFWIVPWGFHGLKFCVRLHGVVARNVSFEGPGVSKQKPEEASYSWSSLENQLNLGNMFANVCIILDG